MPTSPATKRIALLTSGGDAPGMNAAIRSIVRMGAFHQLEVLGIRRGYEGLLAGQIVPMGPRDVSNIIQRGGTILKTSRSAEFKTEAGVQRAATILEKHRVDALILIGGDGTFHGGAALSEFWRGQIIGVPGTIDNDLFGTDFTIGFDTALNTALEAIDKLRDTADSHDRIFIVEVMGRHSGFIGLGVGVTGGGEEILLPEWPNDLREVAQRLTALRDRGKNSSILVIAEGNPTGGAEQVAATIQAISQIQVRTVTLGHVQRGGSPTAADRLLATKLGAYAVDLCRQGASGVMAGEVNFKLCATPFQETWQKKKNLDRYLQAIQPALVL